VIAYWVLLAEDGRREELSWIEKKKAYGFTIKPDRSVKCYEMALVAAPERQITVKKDKDAVRAEVVIAGRPSVLEKMYINASDGLTGPKSTISRYMAKTCRRERNAAKRWYRSSRPYSSPRMTKAFSFIKDRLR